eukprot:scaffold945_cov170-Amphora_coffeaeformis.AAC.3
MGSYVQGQITLNFRSTEPSLEWIVFCFRILFIAPPPPSTLGSCTSWSRSDVVPIIHTMTYCVRAGTGSFMLTWNGQYQVESPLPSSRLYLDTTLQTFVVLLPVLLHNSNAVHYASGACPSHSIVWSGSSPVRNGSAVLVSFSAR